MVKQERLYSAEQPPNHRPQSSITAPDRFLQPHDGPKHRHHQRPSDTVHSAVPFHMRTVSMGHHRDLSTASSIFPLGSPATNSPNPEDHLFRPMYGGQGQGQSTANYHQRQQPPLMQFLGPSHHHIPVGGYPHPHHGGFDPNYATAGSPGPIVFNSPRHLPGLTGLTPFLNASPYMEPADPGVKRFYTPNLDSMRDQPPKRRRLEEPEQDLFDIPLTDYSENVAEQEWSEDDISELLSLMESAEKYKWRYVSDQLYTVKQKRIPSLACSRKFKDMFGVPEASSALESSLFYVALRNGWLAIKDQRTSAERKQELRKQQASRARASGEDKGRS